MPQVSSAATVVLLALLLWLGWPWAAPAPPLLGVLSPISFGVGVIRELLFFLWTMWVEGTCVTSTQTQSAPASMPQLQWLVSRRLAGLWACRSLNMHSTPFHIVRQLLQEQKQCWGYCCVSAGVTSLLSPTRKFSDVKRPQRCMQA